MIVIYNRLIPFKGFLAMTVWPLMFVRSDARELTDTDVNHESIHARQQIEMMVTAFAIATIVFFFGGAWWTLLTCPVWYFLWYGVEYIIRCIAYAGDTRKAYRNILFEQEAFAHQDEEDYLDKRKPFAWLFKK
jgi:hypothetical protein